MPQPYDYSSVFAGLPDPSQAFMLGLQQGNGIQQMQAQQAQQQAQLRQQAQQAQVINALISKQAPTADDYARATLAVPGMREQFKQSWEMHSADQQQSSLAEIGQVHAALTAGKLEYAVGILRGRAEALKNSNADPKLIKAAEDMAATIETNPAFARSLTGMKLASIPGGDKVLANLGAMGVEDRAAAEAPVKLRGLTAEAVTKEATAEVAPAMAEAGLSKAQAEAKTAGVTAKFAESQALADLETRGWNIKALQADIDFKKQSVRIAAMGAAFANKKDAREAEELRLKIDDAKRVRDEKVREKVGAAETGASAMDNMINTIARIKKSPGLRDVVGSIEGADLYPTQGAAVVSALNPFTSSSGDDRADAIALIETLGSQAFLSQIQNIRGMGQLSNVEGDKLQAAFQNLKRKQSEKQFNASLDEATRLLMKARSNLSKTSGVPLSKPDAPAAPGARPPLDSFFK
jgi:hypothetical protein